MKHHEYWKQQRDFFFGFFWWPAFFWGFFWWPSLTGGTLRGYRRAMHDRSTKHFWGEVGHQIITCSKSGNGWRPIIIALWSELFGISRIGRRRLGFMVKEFVHALGPKWPDLGDAPVSCMCQKGIFGEVCRTLVSKTPLDLPTRGVRRVGCTL